MQAAGVFNINQGAFRGLQAAGVFNLGPGPVSGVQAAGVFNLAQGPLSGAQLSGVFNHASFVSGAQVGLVNISGEVRGSQVGLVNVATGEVRGTQVGLVNVSRSMRGLPVGLVNVSEKGGFSLSGYVTEDGLGYVALQMSSGLLYTVLYGGTRLAESPTLFAADLGLGLHVLRYEKERVQPFSHWFLLGAGFALWLTWQVSTALGIFLGTAIPAAWSLDFALPLTFIAMVVPVLKNRPAVAAALSAGLVALAAYSLPYKLGLILAALVGILVGTFLEGRQTS